MASFNDPGGQSCRRDLQSVSTELLLQPFWRGRGADMESLLGTAVPFLLAHRELSFHLDAYI